MTFWDFATFCILVYYRKNIGRFILTAWEASKK